MRHVVTVMAGVDPDEPRLHHRCERCGERLVVSLPIKVTTFVEVSRGFIRAHKDCRPSQQPEEK